ncbi:hypothetical protein HMPREF9088_1986 [Enterococcus italicus DSM 15952]|uniref:Uncharacterized protein n=1 Tax=Enterococcus italicus (strain DSM 15952 / CCUG 50447 / LMG 22039 / TP 1.5) TaxID=888064 RepID=E6LHZ6_ENTI1|nr:hypothetical protein HMPREF9088_1986 [Enterococcus italicus DSM 15952]OJG60172.1 hypothetical protein RT43_GL002042 [Enterococcus italicus DSM 15952]
MLNRMLPKQIYAFYAQYASFRAMLNRMLPKLAKNCCRLSRRF